MNSPCPSFPFCDELKSLWSHVQYCSDNNCLVSNCTLSKQILFHYQSCPNHFTCQLCSSISSSVPAQQQASVPVPHEPELTPLETEVSQDSPPLSSSSLCIDIDQIRQEQEDEEDDTRSVRSDLTDSDDEVEPAMKMILCSPITNKAVALDKSKEKQLRLHLLLLSHAWTCESTECMSLNCRKMKGFLAHAQSWSSGKNTTPLDSSAPCSPDSAISSNSDPYSTFTTDSLAPIHPDRATSPNESNPNTATNSPVIACALCRRLASLFKLHAQTCKNRFCTIPHCQERRKKHSSPSSFSHASSSSTTNHNGNQPRSMLHHTRQQPPFRR